MKLEAAIKKIEKRLGKNKVVLQGMKAYVYHNGKVLEFFTRNGTEDHCSNWYIRRDGDQDDLMTDYFCGSFRQNLTQALDSLQPPPSKFKKGDTVRFKDTKRNERRGRAGKIAIVLTDEASASHWTVMCPDGTKHTYCNIRDIGAI